MKNKLTYSHNLKYTFLLTRELSSFIVALYSIYFLIKLYIISMGENYYNSYSFLFSGSLNLIIAVVALIFALLHTVTWYLLLPRIQPVKMSGKIIRNEIIFSSIFVIWIIFMIIFIIFVY
jgi:fumarate reductase subunit C